MLQCKNSIKWKQVCLVSQYPYIPTVLCTSKLLIALLDVATSISCTPGGPQSAESAPAISVLANRVAAKIPDKWKKVALQLELSVGVIQRDQQDSFDQFMVVMYEWKDSLSRPFTWDTIVAVLKSDSVNETRLASELQREFC